MLIQILLNLIIVFDQECILVGDQIEIDSLPYLFHLIQTHLNIVLLGCSLPNFNTNICEVDESEINNFFEIEICIRLDIKTHFTADLLPMSFSHSLLLQGNHNRNFGFEFIKLSFNNLSNFENGFNLSFFEESNNSTDCSHTIFNKFLSCNCVKCLPFTIHPVINVCKPLISCHPQIGIRSKLFSHCCQLAIIR